MNIVITGSIAFDYLMSFPGDFMEHIKPDKLNKLSLSFLVDEMRKVRGGCAANIAFNLAMLGERPVMMGTVGQDFGEYRAWLEAHGVDTSLTREIPDVFTASFFVNTDNNQNQIASFYTGAMAYARELSFHDVERPGRFDHRLAERSGSDGEVSGGVQELGIPYIYDPSQQIVRMDGAVLREGVEGADMLIVNDYEFELLKDSTGMSDDDIRDAVTRAVIVTRGEAGSTIWADGDEITVPVVPPTQVLDPTGVGDAYRAGLIKGLALGLSWQICGAESARWRRPTSWRRPVRRRTITRWRRLASDTKPSSARTRLRTRLTVS